MWTLSFDMNNCALRRLSHNRGNSSSRVVSVVQCFLSGFYMLSVLIEVSPMMKIAGAIWWFCPHWTGIFDNVYPCSDESRFLYRCISLRRGLPLPPASMIMLNKFEVQQRPDIAWMCSGFRKGLLASWLCFLYNYGDPWEFIVQAASGSAEYRQLAKNTGMSPDSVLVTKHTCNRISIRWNKRMWVAWAHGRSASDILLLINTRLPGEWQRCHEVGMVLTTFLTDRSKCPVWSRPSKLDSLISVNIKKPILTYRGWRVWLWRQIYLQTVELCMVDEEWRKFFL